MFDDYENSRQRVVCLTRKESDKSKLAIPRRATAGAITMRRIPPVSALPNMLMVVFFEDSREAPETGQKFAFLASPVVVVRWLPIPCATSAGSSVRLFFVPIFVCLAVRFLR